MQVKRKIELKRKEKTMTMSPEEEDAWCRNNSGCIGSKISRFLSVGLVLAGVLPSLEEIQEGLGTWAIVLYSVASTTTVILLLQFAVLIRSICAFQESLDNDLMCDENLDHRQFIMCVEAARLKNTIWVNSVFAVLSVFNLVSRGHGNYRVICSGEYSASTGQ